MGKDLVKTDSKKDNNDDQSRNKVDQLLKSKNRFRSGLGFKQGKSNKEEEKAKISQGVSRKKILQGTRGDKTHLNEEGEFAIPTDSNQNHEIELGNRNFVSIDEADENIALSQQAFQKKSKYYDPRQAFLERIKQEEKDKS
jgi:hypothetical protein